MKLPHPSILRVIPLLLVSATAVADEAQQKLEAAVSRLPVVAHYDQPYAGNDNYKQKLDLFLPKDRAGSGPLPVVVFIHGGGWANGDRKSSANRVLEYVRTGRYAGVTVSYRLSAEAHWPAQIHDCKAAIRWIRGNAEKHGLDPARIGVFGSSAGGHLSSLLGTSGGVAELEGDLGEFDGADSRVTCVVNICGPQDFLLPLMFRDGEPVLEDPAVAGLVGGPLAENRDKVVAASPVIYASQDDAPFLSLHGTRDARVDFRHAERIEAALEAAGVPSILIPVAEGGHGLNHPDIPGLISKFFGRHLLGEEVEIAEKPLEPVAKP